MEQDLLINGIVIFNNDEVVEDTTGIVLSKIQDYDIIRYDDYIKPVIISKYLIKIQSENEDFNNLLFIVNPKDIKKVLTKF